MAEEEKSEESVTPKPAKRRKCLSLSRKKKKTLSPTSRFSTMVGDDEVSSMSKGYVPPNTQKNTDWAVKNFGTWRDQRNEKVSSDDEKCPPELLSSTDTVLLSKWLCLFVNETRRSDGTLYPPRTLYQLLCGLLRHCKSLNPEAPNFLDRNDHRFRELHNVCDSYFRRLHSEGVGSEVKETPTISKEEENELWRIGILGLHCPKSLLRTTFFCVGKAFCLRGREEHRSLKVSQFERKYSPDSYIYTEHGSKNRNGGLSHIRLKNKVVPVFANPEAGDRCVVKILDVYISKLPSRAREEDIFYLQPLPAVPPDPQSPWFRNQPVGKNTLSTMVKDMFEEAGIQGKTNHSLRATGVTDMYRAGVPEKLMLERTGHRSLDGLRAYEKSSIEQHQSVSNIMTSKDVTLYSADKIDKTADEKGTSMAVSNVEEKMCTEMVEKSLSSLFSCSNGATFNFCPSGNVVINVTPNVTGFAVKESESSTSMDQTL